MEGVVLVVGGILVILGIGVVIGALDSGRQFFSTFTIPTGGEFYYDVTFRAVGRSQLSVRFNELSNQRSVD